MTVYIIIDYFSKAKSPTYMDTRWKCYPYYLRMKNVHMCYGSRGVSSSGSKVINSWISVPPQGDPYKRLRWCLWDFPGGSVVKNLLANSGDPGLIPGPGGSLRVAEAVRHNYWAYALALRRCNYWSPQILKLCSTTREAPGMRSPHSTTRKWFLLTPTTEKPVQQWRPSISKNLKNEKEIFLKDDACQANGAGKRSPGRGDTHGKAACTRA